MLKLKFCFINHNFYFQARDHGMNTEEESTPVVWSEDWDEIWDCQFMESIYFILVESIQFKKQSTLLSICQIIFIYRTCGTQNKLMYFYDYRSITLNDLLASIRLFVITKDPQSSFYQRINNSFFLNMKAS